MNATFLQLFFAMRGACLSMHSLRMFLKRDQVGENILKVWILNHHRIAEGYGLNNFDM